jgi:hypothetical protein
MERERRSHRERTRVSLDRTQLEAILERCQGILRRYADSRDPAESTADMRTVLMEYVRNPKQTPTLAALERRVQDLENLLERLLGSRPAPRAALPGQDMYIRKHGMFFTLAKMELSVPAGQQELFIKRIEEIRGRAIALFAACEAKASAASALMAKLLARPAPGHG